MILSVDPGGQIGYVRGRPCQPPKLLDLQGWGETRDHLLFMDHVELGCRLGFYLQLVVEGWQNRGGRPRTWQPDAQEQIGMLRWIAWRHGVPLAVQTVGEAKEFATPAKMRLFHDDHVGRGSKEDHAEMALKHLIRFRWVDYYDQLQALAAAGRIGDEER